MDIHTRKTEGRFLYFSWDDNYKRSGFHSTAVVTDISSERRQSHAGSTSTYVIYQVEYEFEVSGRKVSTTERVVGDWGKLLRKGAEIPIQYLTADGRRPTLGPKASFYKTWLWATLGTVFVGLSLLLGGLGYKASRENQSL